MYCIIQSKLILIYIIFFFLIVFCIYNIIGKHKHRAHILMYNGSIISPLRLHSGVSLISNDLKSQYYIKQCSYTIVVSCYPDWTTLVPYIRYYMYGGKVNSSVLSLFSF